MAKVNYELIVGNIGSVYAGTSKSEAEKHYKAYVEQSQSDVGRAGGENVTLMADGEQPLQFARIRAADERKSGHVCPDAYR